MIARLRQLTIRLAIAQHAPPAAIRAQPAPDVFALAEGLAEHEGEQREWQAALAGRDLELGHRTG